jgi:uncharacterized repeat protein (TIGR03803 family)
MNGESVRKILPLIILSIVFAGQEVLAADTIMQSFAAPTSTLCQVQPTAPLTFSGSNLYGTTPGGGNCGFGVPGSKGTVFKITPSGTFTTLWMVPVTTSTPLDHLVGTLWVDASKNIYGTSSGTAGAGESCGTVWELVYNSTTLTYTENTLYTFTGGTVGCTPQGGVIRDSSGNLYGTTAGGGVPSTICGNGCGVVFKLAKTSSGYVESVLHTFVGADGQSPMGSIATSNFADFSNIQRVHLYGTTQKGGASNLGTTWEITLPVSGSSLSFKSLHSFSGGTTDGATPTGTLYATQNGMSFIGTTQTGGTNNLGTVFQISGAANTVSIIHSFIGPLNDGQNPQGSVIADSSGNLYGTTLSGGNGPFGSAGTIFKLTLGTSGSYTESILYNFLASPDGKAPTNALAINGSLLYGTTTIGGSSNNGTIFSIVH